MKHKESGPTSKKTSQVWIGLVVLVAITMVLGLKYLGPDADPEQVGTEGTSVVCDVPTAEATSVEQSSALSAPTDGPTDAPVQPTTDPYPADPVAQLAWVQRNKKPAMILFHSTTCIPCKKMEALVAKIRDDYEPDVYFVDVITNDKSNSALVRQAGIQAIPTTFFINGDGQGKKAVGAMTEEALRDQLDLLRDGGL